MTNPPSTSAQILPSALWQSSPVHPSEDRLPTHTSRLLPFLKQTPPPSPMIPVLNRQSTPLYSVLTTPLSQTLIYLHAILREESQKPNSKVMVCVVNSPLANVMARLYRIVGDVGTVFEEPRVTDLPASSNISFDTCTHGVLFKRGKATPVEGLTFLIWVGHQLGAARGTSTYLPAFNDTCDMNLRREKMCRSCLGNGCIVIEAVELRGRC